MHCFLGHDQGTVFRSWCVHAHQRQGICSYLQEGQVLINVNSPNAGRILFRSWRFRCNRENSCTSFRHVALFRKPWFFRGLPSLTISEISWVHQLFVYKQNFIGLTRHLAYLLLIFLVEKDTRIRHIREDEVAFTFTHVTNRIWRSWNAMIFLWCQCPSPAALARLLFPKLTTPDHWLLSSRRQFSQQILR